MNQRKLSARSGIRVLRVARSLADLADQPRIGNDHLAQALCFRSFDAETSRIRSDQSDRSRDQRDCPGVSWNGCTPIGGGAAFFLRVDCRWHETTSLQTTDGYSELLTHSDLTMSLIQSGLRQSRSQQVELPVLHKPE